MQSFLHQLLLRRRLSRVEGLKEAAHERFLWHQVFLRFQYLVVDLFSELACAIEVELLGCLAEWGSLVHAHDKLARVEYFQLESLVDEMILRDHVQRHEIIVLLQLIQSNLLLSEILLYAPKSSPVIFLDENNLSLVLHRYQPC